jgi:hypothetical protein
MPDMLAIISKAVFEKEAADRKLGDVLPLDKYRSASAHLKPLQSGGRLFLVTVRPPKEALWLVAVLEGLKFKDEEWRSSTNRVPIKDITGLIPLLRFESGKGITASKGALGMSLQTPRALSAADVTLLLGPSAAAAPEASVPVGPINLTAHDTEAKLPCLCKRCLPQAPEHATLQGMAFTRSQVETDGKALHYWMPDELLPQAPEISKSVLGSLRSRV